MTQKLPLLVVFALLLAGGVFWLSHEKAIAPTVPVEEPSQPSQTDDSQQTFVTDVDPDVSHWQTKETKYMVYKFPKEWYLKESDLKKTGYYSVVITNNPDFDIDKYPDISIGIGGGYPKVLKNDSEVVISTNNLGWITSETGTPRQFMDLKFDQSKKYNKSNVDCKYISNPDSVPLLALCSYVDTNDQNIMIYYVSKKQRTYTYTAVFSTKNNSDKIEYILEQIAREMIVVK